MVKRVWVAPKRFALIDDEDAERVAKFDWRMTSGGRTNYAKTESQRLGAKWRWLHRYIVDAPPDAIVDHINGNGLDNRRENLRIVTSAQNSQNQFVQAGNDKTSRFKGVHWDSGASRWVASIASRYLGQFIEEADAARAYDRAAVAAWGEYSRTNESMGLYDGQQPVERNAMETRSVKQVAGAYANETAQWRANYKLGLSPNNKRVRALQRRRKQAAERAARLSFQVGLPGHGGSP